MSSAILGSSERQKKEKVKLVEVEGVEERKSREDIEQKKSEGSNEVFIAIERVYGGAG